MGQIWKARKRQHGENETQKEESMWGLSVGEEEKNSARQGEQGVVGFVGTMQLNQSFSTSKKEGKEGRSKSLVNWRVGRRQRSRKRGLSKK